MPRKKRIHYFQAMYHITLRGHYRQNIFFNENDYAKFCNYLSDANEAYDCKIHLFCLMTNHVHLVIEVGQIPLAKIMQNIISRYARYINIRLNRTGSLCESRYKATLVHNEKYLFELCYYIHMNPLRAAIVNNLELYSWSSHHSYANQSNPFPWVTTKFILDLIEKQNMDYQNFMLNLDNTYEKPSFCKLGENGELIICDALVMKGQSEPIFHLNLPLNKIIEVICEELQISQEKLASCCLSQRAVLGRSIVTYFAHYHAGYFLTDIAISLDRQPDSISKTTHKTLKQIRQNPKLTKLVQVIQNKLIQQALS